MFSKLKRLPRQAVGTKADVLLSAKHANPPETISRTSSRIYDSKQNGGYMTGQTAPLTTSLRSTFNVVLFGEIGVGKSAVVNLIAQKDIAAVSPDANPCTMQYKCYDIPLDGMDLAIYDTAGLEEPQIGVNSYLTAVERAYELINKLGAAGGIHLLLFCMRGGRITATTQSNYRLFRECLCNTRVPIALIFTCLEREVEMEDWWRRNKKDIEGYGIKSDGHACVTAVQDDEDNHKYLESQERMRRLLKDCATKYIAFSPETHSWFARFTMGMKGFIKGKTNPKEKDLMKVLTRRCKLDQDVARKVVAMIENGDVDAGNGDGEPGTELASGQSWMNDRPPPREHADSLAFAKKMNGESVPNKESPHAKKREDGKGTETAKIPIVNEVSLPNKKEDRQTWNAQEAGEIKSTDFEFHRNLKHGQGRGVMKDLVIDEIPQEWMVRRKLNFRRDLGVETSRSSGGGDGDGGDGGSAERSPVVTEKMPGAFITR